MKILHLNFTNMYLSKGFGSKTGQNPEGASARGAFTWHFLSLIAKNADIFGHRCGGRAMP